MSFNKSSNLLENRCPQPTTTDCVSWVGESVPCLNVCTGDTLTALQCEVLNTLCSLLSDVDMSTVTINCPSLATAFGTADPTILNFIQFLLNQLCLTNTLLGNVINGTEPLQNQNPVITVTYPSCCAPSACGGGTTVTISQHLTNVLNCLCNIYTLIGNIPQGYSNIGCALTNLNTIVNNQQNYLLGQAEQINNIVTILNSQGLNPNNTAQAVPIPPTLSFTC